MVLIDGDGIWNITRLMLGENLCFVGTAMDGLYYTYFCHLTAATIGEPKHLDRSLNGKEPNLVLSNNVEVKERGPFDMWNSNVFKTGPVIEPFSGPVPGLTGSTG
ncbi:hypothetical protein SLEP1_g18197 [Rubroshorea leprosula]|uniref:Uncharacterized protein n=1 Tax=Rubroshorea leprosula TaxID=152421 RepID=A0AAV5J2K4_9ROSI|nr:hypothetical protein SLEP1_g18197 [Rubroshorea leprosula]